jgi:hypothetical protein
MVDPKGPPAMTLVAGAPAANFVKNLYKTSNGNYFWSHGYQVGLDHTIATSIKTAPGHKTESTKANIMGGDTWVSEFLSQSGDIKIDASPKTGLNRMGHCSF